MLCSVRLPKQQDLKQRGLQAKLKIVLNGVKNKALENTVFQLKFDNILSFIMSFYVMSCQRH